jgi:TIGR03009 family protein
MRGLALSLTLLLALGAAVLGQQGAPQPSAAPQAQPQQLPALNPASDPLDWVLVRWEKSMSEISSFEADCERTSEDKVWRKKTIFIGKAKYLKTPAANLASLELKMKNQPDIFEKYICTGTFLYMYDLERKQIRAKDLPKPPPGQVAENNFLAFLFGMKAAQAKFRYNLKYVPPPPNDKYYYFIEIAPKNVADKADFSRARLVVLRSNFMPRQLWFEEPNGNETTWDFPRISAPANLSILEFREPTPPPGWELRREHSLNQPRITRSQQ